MKQQAITSLKIFSTIFIASTLLIESWNIYLHLNNNSLPAKFNPLLWFGAIALLAHFIEGIIAAFNANSQQKNPLTYGIYTFFVGFVGLSELFDGESVEKVSRSPH